MSVLLFFVVCKNIMNFGAVGQNKNSRHNYPNSVWNEKQKDELVPVKVRNKMSSLTELSVLQHVDNSFPEGHSTHKEATQHRSSFTHQQLQGGEYTSYNNTLLVLSLRHMYKKNNIKFAEQYKGEPSLLFP